MKNQSQREKMIALVTEWKESGKTQVSFAQEHEISLYTFKYWIYKFRQEGTTPGGFIRLDQIAAPELCLRYPNGVELLVPFGTPYSTIREFINL